MRSRFDIACGRSKVNIGRSKVTTTPTTRNPSFHGVCRQHPRKRQKHTSTINTPSKRLDVKKSDTS